MASDVPCCKLLLFPILDAIPRGADLGKLVVFNNAIINEVGFTYLQRKVNVELMKEMGTIGSSNGWVATLEDGLGRLQDDLNSVASDTDMKRIPLPPLVTLPHCQTCHQRGHVFIFSRGRGICVVAVKFLGTSGLSSLFLHRW